MSENENKGAVNLSANSHVYKDRLDECEAWLNYVSIPRNCDGRPVWEPKKYSTIRCGLAKSTRRREKLC